MAGKSPVQERWKVVDEAPKSWWRGGLELYWETRGAERLEA